MRRRGGWGVRRRRSVARFGAMGPAPRPPAPATLASADAPAWSRARRPRACRLTRHQGLAATEVRSWRPTGRRSSSAGGRRPAHPHDPTQHLSAETIYRGLYVHARGMLRRELTAHLRRPCAGAPPVAHGPRWASVDCVSSPRAPPRCPTAQCRASERATCSWATRRRAWRPWSNVPVASAYSSRCRARAARASSTRASWPRHACRWG